MRECTIAIWCMVRAAAVWCVVRAVRAGGGVVRNRLYRSVCSRGGVCLLGLAGDVAAQCRGPRSVRCRRLFYRGLQL